MKKIILTVVAGAVALLTLAGAGLAYAGANDIEIRDALSGVGRFTPNGELFHRRGGDRIGLVEYIHEALADAFDLSVEDLEARLADGEYLLDIAGEQGLTVEEFHTLVADAHRAAVDNALADGAITAEQAERLRTFDGFGPHGHGVPNGIGPGAPGFGPGGFGPGEFGPWEHGRGHHGPHGGPDWDAPKGDDTGSTDTETVDG